MSTSNTQYMEVVQRVVELTLSNRLDWQAHSPSTYVAHYRATDTDLAGERIITLQRTREPVGNVHTMAFVTGNHEIMRIRGNDSELDGIMAQLFRAISDEVSKREVANILKDLKNL